MFRQTSVLSINNSLKLNDDNLVVDLQGISGISLNQTNWYSRYKTKINLFRRNTTGETSSRIFNGVPTIYFNDGGIRTINNAVNISPSLINNMTIECYCYIPTLTLSNNTIMEIGNGSVGDLQILVNNLNQARFQRGGVAGSTASITYNRWNHLVGVKKNNLLNIYVNGVKGTDHDSGSPNNKNDLTIGYLASNIFALTGYMYLFRIYVNKEMTQNEILSNYNILRSYVN